MAGSRIWGAVLLLLRMSCTKHFRIETLAHADSADLRGFGIVDDRLTRASERAIVPPAWI
jgi:hypothetical protein